MNVKLMAGPVIVVLGLFSTQAAASDGETASPVAPAPETEAPVALSWSGYLQTDIRMNVNDPKDLSWQEYRLDLRPELKLGTKARFYGEIWMRELGFPQLHRFNELQKPGSILPLDISLRKAYVDIYGVGFPSLDLTIGRQRIVWGTADKINPTDNLDPNDLEDIWDVGRHFGSDGIKAKYYLGPLTLSAVFLPIFRPAILPQGGLAEELFLKKNSELINAIIDQKKDTVIMPELKPKESFSAGFKTAVHLTGFDASASYAYCRDDFPLLSEIIVTPQAKTTSQAILDVADGMLEIKEAKLKLIYPRLHIAGIDMAAMIGRWGIWGEAAVFVPEKRIKMQTTYEGNDSVPNVFSAINYKGAKNPTLLDGPYIKYVIGMDFTFPWKMYISAQYAHGYVHERGDSLGNYIFMNADWSLFNNKLKITPFGIILEVKDFEHFNDCYALVDQPQLSWYPVDNAEIRIGVRLIQAQPGTFFSNLDTDEAFFMFKYSF